MEEKGRLIVAFLVISIVIGIAVYFLFGYLATLFFYGYPGVAEAKASDPTITVGIASAVFTTLFLMYPVMKYGDRSGSGDDYR